MAQSLSRVLIHLVFSTKNRDPLIGPGLKDELHAYLGGTLNAISCPVVRVGGTADHLHALCQLSRTIAIADLVGEVKASSSRWMKRKGCDDFAWQGGYGAFSVSESQVDHVVSYIDSQDEHHRRLTFQEEFRAFLLRHHIAFDERYVWD